MWNKQRWPRPQDGREHHENGSVSWITPLESEVANGALEKCLWAKIILPACLALLVASLPASAQSADGWPSSYGKLYVFRSDWNITGSRFITYLKSTAGKYGSKACSMKGDGTSWGPAKRKSECPRRSSGRHSCYAALLGGRSRSLATGAPKRSARGPAGGGSRRSGLRPRSCCACCAVRPTKRRRLSVVRTGCEVEN